MKFKFNRRKLTFRRFTYYLLIATIVISCITNGIFAKFTTEDDGGDEARVADFGVVVSISGDLFSTAYSVNTATDIKDGDTVLLSPEGSNNPTIYTAKDNTVSVKASSDKTDDGKLNNIVAPGTKNDVGISVSVTGKPETDCQLNYALAGFETIFLSGGDSEKGTSYGLMVPFEKGIVNKSNFNELVEAGIYTSKNVTENGKTYQKYTLVGGSEVFNETAEYFKLKDEVTVPIDNSYMPIKYYVNTKTETETETIISKNLLNPSYKGSAELIKNEFLPNFATNTFPSTFADGMSYFGDLFGSKQYNTNAEVNENFNITWEWPYHQIENPTTDEEKKEFAWCNACDTILGYIAAGKNVVKGTIGNDGNVIPDKDGTSYNNNLVTCASLDELMYSLVFGLPYPDYNLDIILNYSITIDQVD